MAQYQLANIYARTGKPDEAVKTYRALADSKSVFVPRPLVLLDLADLLRRSNPAEAANLYQQIKKEFADNSAVSERADRGLELIGPKS
jgi:TolA-binding protein